MIEHLPQELRDRFTEMREMDLTVQSKLLWGAFHLLTQRGSAKSCIRPLNEAVNLFQTSLEFWQLFQTSLEYFSSKLQAEKEILFFYVANLAKKPFLSVEHCSILSSFESNLPNTTLKCCFLCNWKTPYIRL